MYAPPKPIVTVVKVVVVADDYGNRKTYKTPRQAANAIASSMVRRMIRNIFNNGGAHPPGKKMNEMHDRAYRRVLKIMEKELS